MKYSILALLLIFSACQQTPDTEVYNPDDPKNFVGPDSTTVKKGGWNWDTAYKPIKRPNTIFVEDQNAVVITDSTHSNHATFTVGPTTMTLYQGEDTIQFPLHPDYKEYIFWWTMTSWHEYTYRTSLLYSKTKPTKERLRREASRMAKHLGYDTTTVIVRECIGFNPDDSTKWDKAEKRFEKQFLATIK